MGWVGCEGWVGWSRRVRSCRGSRWAVVRLVGSGGSGLVSESRGGSGNLAAGLRVWPSDSTLPVSDSVPLIQPAPSPYMVRCFF